MKNEVEELLQAISGDLQDIKAGVDNIGRRVFILSGLLSGIALPSPDPDEPIDPEEPVEPEKPEEPPVASPGEIVLSQLVREPQNLADIILFRLQHQSSRYERFNRDVVLDGNYNLRATRFNISTGGGIIPFVAGTYHLIVDGKEHKPLEVEAGTTDIYFTGNTNEFSPGWRRLQVQRPGGQRSPSWFVHAGKEQVDNFVPVYTNVYDMINRTANHDHLWQLVSADAKPKPVPLSANKFFKPFSELPAPNQLAFRQVAINCNEKRVYWNNGRPTFAGRQAYFYSDLIKDLPSLPLLDGPRGIGTMYMPTHINVGTATQTEDPTSTPRRVLYVCDPWRLVRMDVEGKITTLVGYRHKRAHYWENNNPPELELVGDWSAVPEERRGCHELWGFCWLSSTLVVDANAAPIPAEENRKPHVHNPVGFLADTQMNRLLKLEFNSHSHLIQPKVSEFATWLNEPWDVVESNVPGNIIVSNRFAHEIIEINTQTEQIVRVIVKGAPLSAMEKRYTPRHTAPLEVRQQQPCVMPEGLFRLGDWLYFSSLSQQQVRRVHLVSGELEVITSFPVDGNSRYTKIAVSDGTFGPAGTVFVSTWSNRDGGYPFAYLPDGSPWKYYQFTANTPRMGVGPRLNSISYGSAVGIGSGRMVFGTAAYGLWDVSLKKEDDVVVDTARYKRGSDKLNPLLFTSEGFSAFGVPLPDGDEDIDYVAQVGGYR